MGASSALVSSETAFSAAFFFFLFALGFVDCFSRVKISPSSIFFSDLTRDSSNGNPENIIRERLTTRTSALSNLSVKIKPLYDHVITTNSIIMLIFDFLYVLPVIFMGPLGINNTVNLNCATKHPSFS